MADFAVLVEVDDDCDIFSFFKSSFFVPAIMILSQEAIAYESYPFANNSFYHFTEVEIYRH